MALVMGLPSRPAAATATAGRDEAAALVDLVVVLQVVRGRRRVEVVGGRCHRC